MAAADRSVAVQRARVTIAQFDATISDTTPAQIAYGHSVALRSCLAEVCDELEAALKKQHDDAATLTELRATLLTTINNIAELKLHRTERDAAMEAMQVSNLRFASSTFAQVSATQQRVDLLDAACQQVAVLSQAALALHADPTNAALAATCAEQRRIYLAMLAEGAGKAAAVPTL